MPVRRFRSIEEMKAQPMWRRPGDPALYRAIAAVWEMGMRTGVHRFPPGVYKHHSMEDLNAQTERWMEENFRAFHARRSAR
jgi:hypothetical protein